MQIVGVWSVGLLTHVSPYSAQTESGRREEPQDIVLLDPGGWEWLGLVEWPPGSTECEMSSLQPRGKVAVTDLRDLQQCPLMLPRTLSPIQPKPSTSLILDATLQNSSLSVLFVAL